jgi:hypothetical protein
MTPAAGTAYMRLIALQDLALTTNPDGETFVEEVWGAGPQTLDKLSPILLTSLTQASNDLTAETAGVQPSQLYYNTTFDAPAALVTPRQEIPTGFVNGANTIFSLVLAPIRLMLYRNGMLLRGGVDYSQAQNVITMRGFSGTCNTNGTVATFVTGDNFRYSMQGLNIVIDSVTYTIVNVLGGNTVILNSAAPVATGKNWSTTGAPILGDELNAYYWR